MSSTTLSRTMRTNDARFGRRSASDYRFALPRRTMPPETVEVPGMQTCEDVTALLDSHPDLYQLDRR